MTENDASISPQASQPQVIRESGMTAVIHSFIDNPAAAVQIFSFAFVLYGMYYAITSEIKETKAATDRKIERMVDKAETLAGDNKEQWITIKSVQQSADGRYNDVLAKLTANEVALARIATNLDNLIDQMRGSRGTTRRLLTTP